MKKGTRRFLSLLLALAMILSHAHISYAADHDAHTHEDAAAEEAAPENGTKELEMEDLDPSSLGIRKLGEITEEHGDEAEISLTPDLSLNQTIRVSIFLDGKGTVDAGFETKGIAADPAAISYRNQLKAQQAAVTARIEAALGRALEVKWNLTLLTNAISADVKVGEIPLIERLDGVASVERERHYEAPVTDGETSPQTANTSENMVGAVNAWYQLGYTGAGSRIAIIDTGLDTAHQSVNADAFTHAIEEVRAAGKDVSLMTQADLNAIQTSQLNSGSHNYLNAKIPYAYNYVDGGTRVNHQDNGSNHGSHVAGIAAANRYIKSGSDYVDAAETVGAVGMAPDAQILVMKVFGTNGGAYDSDYFAAIEDAVVLGADAANLSLGSSSPGFTYAGSTYQSILNGLVNKKDLHMVLSISAGNAYAADDFTPHKLYAEDVNFHTGGSPGSYLSSLSVAAAQNTLSEGTPLIFNGSQQVFYAEDTESSEGSAYSNPAMTSVAGTWDYVYIDAPGETSDYAAVNDEVPLAGRIVIVNRGVQAFTEKGNNLKSYKPKAFIVANNADGVIHMDLSDFTGSFPFVSISLKDAEAIKAAGTARQAGGVTYYTGTVEVTTTEVTTVAAREDAQITDFSSWGVPGSLIMKPEITAPGGDIYSINGTSSYSGDSNTGTTAYVSYSGTSMAAPHIAGLSAVLMQYLKEQTPDNEALMSGRNLRTVADSLLMSTATPMKNQNAYLSVLQQGAGLAEVSNAIQAKSVILMEDASLTSSTGAATDGKVKVELGDDPQKKGEYRFSFSVYNISDEILQFTLDTDLFTQAVTGDTLSHKTALLPAGGVRYEWEGAAPAAAADGHDVDRDGDTDEDDAQAILDFLAGFYNEKEDLLDLNAGDLDGDEMLSSYDAYLLLGWEQEESVPEEGYTVAPHGKALVTVSISLTAAQKAALNKAGGAYLEGFTYVTCNTVTEEGESLSHEHSIPILGYYGSWTEPSMFDTNSYTEELYGSGQENYSGAAAADTNYMRITTDGATVKFSGNPYMVERNAEGTPVFPEERLAIRSDVKLNDIRYNLIRSAGGTGFAVSKLDGKGDVNRIITASVTGTEVTGLWYNVNQGTWQNTAVRSYSVGRKLNEFGSIAEGDRIRIGYYAVPEYNVMTVSDDMTAAEAGLLTEAAFRKILSSNVLGRGAMVGFDFTVDDTAPVIESAVLNGTVLSLTAGDNENLAYVAVMSLDGTTKYFEKTPGEGHGTFSVDVAEAIADADGYVAVFAGDYAGNEAAKAVKVNNNTSGTDPYTVTGLSLTPDSLDLYKGNTADLTVKVTPITAEDRGVTWSSSNSSVASVDENGHVTALAAGTAAITAVSKSSTQVKATCSVKVTAVSKDLNAIIWDEEGQIFFSGFNAGSLPAWNKLHGEPQDKELHAAFYQASRLYAATLDTGSETSTLYTVNTDNYSLTEVGNLTYFATDIAPGPTTYASQYGVMVQPYAIYLLVGSATDPSGGIYGSKDVSGTIGDNIYIAAVAAKSLSARSAVYYFLDENGIIWQISLNGTTFGTPTKIVETGISTSFAYQSLYYDGSYLYWSHQDGDVSELIVINPQTKAVYHAGDFGPGVWPVTGLYVNGSLAPALAGDDAADAPEELQLIPGHELATEEIKARYAQALKKAGRDAVSAAAVEETPAAAESEAEFSGSLQIIRGAAGVNAAEIIGDEDESLIPVALYEETAVHNGLYFIEYDPEMLEFDHVSCLAAHFACFDDTEKGVVTFAFAETEEIPAGEEIARLVFRVNACGKSELCVTTLERGDELGLNEQFVLPVERISYTLNETKLTLPVGSSRQLILEGCDGSVGTGSFTSSDESVVTVDENGLVTALKYHSGPVAVHVTMANGYEADCEVQTLFWDVADSSKYYFRHVYWAAEKGITKGYDLEYFAPQETCKREQMMTFLWRLAGEPEPKTASSKFPDVKKGSYYYKAVLWGVENGITKGYSSGEYAGLFGTGLPCTREQAMTFLWRMAGKPEPKTTVNPFADMKPKDYFYKAVLWAAENGIANGYTTGEYAGKYGVGLDCLREHMVTFLSRYSSKIMNP